MLLDSNIHGDLLVKNAVNTIQTSKQAASEIIYSPLKYFRKLQRSYMKRKKKKRKILKELFST